MSLCFDNNNVRGSEKGVVEGYSLNILNDHVQLPFAILPRATIPICANGCTLVYTSVVFRNCVNTQVSRLSLLG